MSISFKRPSINSEESTSTHSPAPFDSNPFDNRGPWEGGDVPAVSLPAELKALQLGSTWTVEFLDVSEGAVLGFGKNHIVARADFAHMYVNNIGIIYYGAMLSMELKEEFVIVDREAEDESGAFVHEGLISEHDYFPGTFWVKLLKYEQQTMRAHASRTFHFKRRLTLGDLVVTKEMHQFVFLSYEGRWKGCGDFIIQMWADLVNRGILEKFFKTTPPSLAETSVQLTSIATPQNPGQLEDVKKNIENEKDPEEKKKQEDRKNQLEEDLKNKKTIEDDKNKERAKAEKEKEAADKSHEAEKDVKNDKSKDKWNQKGKHIFK
ncbi:hypothetical protein Clacol_005885 [Clathrus columnatus]|uniref:Uncharacterized protein n=1 Tax=Clathrus columnatus TaxID=1419009 RepID=A0AAV5AG32_9AGAM|nr:hypothetical protein Clacol_005885 [Clathrus columnatus]